MQFKKVILTAIAVYGTAVTALIPGRPTEYANNLPSKIFFEPKTPYEIQLKAREAVNRVGDWTGNGNFRISEAGFLAILSEKAIDAIYEAIGPETKVTFSTSGGVYGDFSPASCYVC